MAREAHYIRIVNVPAGEAPLWVREKWVGLELPLVRVKKTRELPWRRACYLDLQTGFALCCGSSWVGYESSPGMPSMSRLL